MQQPNVENVTNMMAGLRLQDTQNDVREGCVIIKAFRYCPLGMNAPITGFLAEHVPRPCSLDVNDVHFPHIYVILFLESRCACPSMFFLNRTGPSQVVNFSSTPDNTE